MSSTASVRIRTYNEDIDLAFLIEFLRKDLQLIMIKSMSWNESYNYLIDPSIAEDIDIFLGNFAFWTSGKNTRRIDYLNIWR